MSTRPRARSGSSTTGTASRSARSGAGPASAICESRTIRLPSPRSPARSSGCVGDIERTFWNIGSTAEPPSLPERLRALGWRDPEPPWEPVAAAMVLAEEPPGADGVEIRRIETFDDHLAGLEIMLASDAFSEEAMARERAEARQTFERRTRRGGLQWLAVLDETPVAFALADRSPVGLYLAGGATLPEARGRGCYRALVRARWDEAVNARPAGARGAGAVRIVGADPAAARIRRDRHGSHAQVAGRSRLSSEREGAPAVPGLPRFASCCRGWARRGGRSRGAQDRRGRSSSPTSSW